MMVRELRGQVQLSVGKGDVQIVGMHPVLHCLWNNKNLLPLETLKYHGLHILHLRSMPTSVVFKMVI